MYDKGLMLPDVNTREAEEVEILIIVCQKSWHVVMCGVGGRKDGGKQEEGDEKGMGKKT